MIKLCSDIIDKNDIEQLKMWLDNLPQLTKGPKTIEFENAFSKIIGCEHSIYCNSGSSANLLITSALQQSNLLRNNKIIVPQISWSTTVFPIIQLGLKPILCDCNLNNLGIDIEHLDQIIQSEKPAAIFLVHVLGLDSNIEDIVKICNENDVLVIEDTCESLGSETNNKKLGNFGLASSFSFYFGHHISTIEGGMVCTNNKQIADLIKMIRSHGWDRDLNTSEQNEYRNKYNVSEISKMYTFYYEGFNLRSTDLQAFIGLLQIQKIKQIVEQREKNYYYYKENIDNKFWKPKTTKNQNVISNMGYPIIFKNRDEMYKLFYQNNIECRPLISGSMGLQPAWKNRFGYFTTKNASIIDKHAMYLPNHQDLQYKDIKFICDIINSNGVPNV